MKYNCRRTEPNICLLDCGKYSLDGEILGSEREEVLRADRIARDRCGYKRRTMIGVQPWCRPSERLEHLFVAEFLIHSTETLSSVWLVLEHPERCRVTLNGEHITANIKGWFADRALKKMRLPTLKRGENTLRIEQPFGGNTDIEACYLLGEFDVTADGEGIRLSPPGKVGFGRVDEQGLKFYARNLEYSTGLRLKAQARLRIAIPDFAGPLIGVFVDGKDLGNIVFAPYELTTPVLNAGPHRIVFRLYGNNYNTFSALHVHPEPVWTGDYSWYADGENWTYDYLTKPFGILSEPKIEIIEEVETWNLPTAKKQVKF